MSMRKLDIYSGVSHSYISQMERGERGVPSPEILEKLAKPLGVEYEELMTKAGYINKDKKVEDLNHIIEFKEYRDIIFEQLKMTNDPKKREELITDLKEWGEITELDQFFNEIDISDEQILNKYHFTYKGKTIAEEKVKKILSYIRFVASEEDSQD